MSLSDDIKRELDCFHHLELKDHMCIKDDWTLMSVICTKCGKECMVLADITKKPNGSKLLWS